MGLIAGFLRLIPIYAYVIAGVALWGFYGHYKANAYEKAKYEADAESLRIAAKASAKKAAAATKVDQTYVIRAREAETRVATLSANNSQLQQLLANKDNSARDAIAVCGIDGERGKALERLLAEGAELAREGGERVARMGTKITALQEHIVGVCVKE
jgi:UDP-N-acetylmuramyl tripeptide synthase